jgi:hypothetical protein
MLRTSVILVASFGLLAGCATSSANSSNTNPPDGDAGKVSYDVGPSGGDGGTQAGAGDDGADKPAIQGRDSTTTRGAAVTPKVAKRVATSKPPKPEEPAEAKPPPKRKGRVDPNGLLGEVFVVPPTTDKLPDFAGLGAAKALFIAKNLDSNATTPLAGLPKGTAAPVALRFTGSLNVLNGAEYQLCVSSIDGSQLYVEDTLIVDNDGLKKDAAGDVCELVTLDPGEYKIEVRSFHVTGPVALRLAWAQGADGTPAAVSMRSLYKPEGADDRVKAGAAK